MRAVIFFILALTCISYANVLCPVCKALLSAAESYLVKHEGEKVVEFIQKQCEKIDNSLLGAVCNKITEFGIPKLVDLLVNHADPETVCTTIHCC